MRYQYTGAVPYALIDKARESFEAYRSDKEPLMARIRDNERFYKKSYSHITHNLEKVMTCDTPLIFSAIENARADAIDNYPSVTILEREPDGTRAAELLTKIIPAQLEISEFKRAYKENIRSKLKYGTAVYGVFFDKVTGNIDIKGIDIADVYVDMNVSDVQDSPFVFIAAAVENDTLRERYPMFRDLFEGDCEAETADGTRELRDRSRVIDCYYKKADGAVHLMKLCRDTVIAATEDMDGYDRGLYDHELYPVVFDVLYPAENSPFGFGMLDIGKATQTAIDKLDRAITENIMCGAKPRYLAKRNGGIDEAEFRDMSKNIVHYEGETDAIVAVGSTPLADTALSHRERKKDELKELLANRDFQQGSTYGGVTAASAIQTLRQTGEKRTRAIISDTYDAYKRIIYMVIELMRQFYSEKRTYRVTDELGQKRFVSLDSSMMFRQKWGDSGVRLSRIMFDIDVVPQHEDPTSRETANGTIMTFYNSGMLAPENAAMAVTALKNMQFDGKEQLIADIEKLRQGEGNASFGGLSDSAAELPEAQDPQKGAG
ncbi:MAG: hypothetical protein IJH37_09635 [Clostridia bacterium]|nr:hypothetical protein [Clostridia bacterium]